MVRELCIKDEKQVQKINDIACKAPYEVWLSCDEVMIDARSLLGIFTLVGKKVNVVAEDYVNPKSFSKLVDKMA